MSAIRMVKAGPLASLQDAGRPGQLRYGVSASGPMDRQGFARAASWLGACAEAGIEFAGGFVFEVEEGTIAVGLDGGDFALRVNGASRPWPARLLLRRGDHVEIAPGAWGNYGYLRFDGEPEAVPLLGSRATNTVSGIGGRVLADGDLLSFGAPVPRSGGGHPRPTRPGSGPVRVIWGLHADAFDPEVRRRFASEDFVVSSRMDRMGVRLSDTAGVFRDQRMLTLVSDATVAGDIQILGDGTPIVLMRDHQPTGGYPRIATVASVDIDRFAQVRPGSVVRFEPVTVRHAQGLLR